MTEVLRIRARNASVQYREAPGEVVIVIVLSLNREQTELRPLNGTSLL